MSRVSLDRKYLYAVIIQVCFPYIVSNKNKCQKSNGLLQKKVQECKVSCSHSLWCQQLPQIVAWATGAEVKVEHGKADPVGCRAYWGKGEGASMANETLRCLKESR